MGFIEVKSHVTPAFSNINYEKSKSIVVLKMPGLSK